MVSTIVSNVYTDADKTKLNSTYAYGRNTSLKLRNIANRMTCPQGFDTPSKQLMSRAWIPIQGGFSGSVQIFLGNAFIQGGTIFGGNSGSSTFKGSIEYKNGTRQQMLFSGVSSGTFATPSIVSVDPMVINVTPDDGGVFVNLHVANPNGVPYSIATTGSAALGDGMVFSTTTTPDLTMSGTVAFASGYTYRPCAMVGMTHQKSIVFVGDSIDKGQGPTGPDARGNNGIIERCLQQEMAGINMSSPGATCQTLAGLSANTGFGTLWQYNDYAQLGAGTNDIFLPSTVAINRTAAQALNDMATLGAKFTVLGIPFFGRTILPQTTGTWTTTAGQTVKFQESERVLFNEAIRNLGVTGMKYSWDITPLVETGYNTGIWQANYTADGVHPLGIASNLIQNSGRINLSAAKGL